MNDVRLDPQQVPARAELLLAAELGEDAPGRPIYARLEPDGDGELAVCIKVGAMLTRRLYVAEATETPAGAVWIAETLRHGSPRAAAAPASRARPARPEPARPAPAGVPTALTGATRVAVIIRRGYSMIGLAQSRDEAGR